MDLNEVIRDMKTGLAEVEPRIIDYWKQSDFATARAVFNYYLSQVHYPYLANKIADGFDRGANVLTSLEVLREVLRRTDFRTSTVEKTIRRFKADLAQTALSDGPADLTIKL